MGVVPPPPRFKFLECGEHHLAFTVIHESLSADSEDHLDPLVIS
jgi:hypothetical protein